MNATTAVAPINRQSEEVQLEVIRLALAGDPLVVAHNALVAAKEKALDTYTDAQRELMDGLIAEALGRILDKAVEQLELRADLTKLAVKMAAH